MKRVVLALFSMLLMLASCKDSLTERVIMKFENGQPAKVQYFNNENQCVREVHYYENGMVYIEGAVKDGQRTGEWNSYFPDGKKQSIGYYENGARTGKAYVYHENGNLYMEGFYKDDHRCGEWITYDEQGYEYSRAVLGSCD